ncbi:MAG: hypothetical protein H7Z40_15220 [Phycisphaerae bacterium]|nr:hypothetical protein [Gemmatimonadaceae bacterium]
MDTTNGERSSLLIVGGLSSAELTAARNLNSDSALQAVAAVTVAGSVTPVLGKYVVNDSALVFLPQFPFDAGRLYEVRINRRRLSSAVPDSATVLSVALPAAARRASTSVARILPSGDTLPENLLRLYLEFSAPMSRTGGLEFIKLLDDSGREVQQAFLPIESDFWNGDRTRYTAFLDPGRVKRGILPNEQLGRALIAGRRYTMVVDSMWRDGNGQPLSGEFRRTFRVSTPDEQRIDFKRWVVSSPAAGSRDTLVVQFEKSLDHGLLKRALGVQTALGRAVPGETDIRRNEREWRFVPLEPWTAGRHSLIVLSFLEDAAGNRVDGAFEVDMFNEIDKNAAQERYLVTFTVFSH